MSPETTAILFALAMFALSFGLLAAKWWISKDRRKGGE
jgi:hypothetical protein